jgi:hypothetical protein
MCVSSTPHSEFRTPHSRSPADAVVVHVVHVRREPLRHVARVELLCPRQSVADVVRVGPEFTRRRLADEVSFRVVRVREGPVEGDPVAGCERRAGAVPGQVVAVTRAVVVRQLVDRVVRVRLRLLECGMRSSECGVKTGRTLL